MLQEHALLLVRAGHMLMHQQLVPSSVRCTACRHVAGAAEQRAGICLCTNTGSIASCVSLRILFDDVMPFCVCSMQACQVHWLQHVTASLLSSKSWLAQCSGHAAAHQTVSSSKYSCSGC